jgi:hypothetical protein
VRVKELEGSGNVIDGADSRAHNRALRPAKRWIGRPVVCECQEKVFRGKVMAQSDKQSTFWLVQQRTPASLLTNIPNRSELMSSESCPPCCTPPIPLVVTTRIPTRSAGAGGTKTTPPSYHHHRLGPIKQLLWLPIPGTCLLGTLRPTRSLSRAAPAAWQRPGSAPSPEVTGRGARGHDVHYA